MSDATNPAPRPEGRPHDERVSWFDMAGAVENEAGRRRIRIGELSEILSGMPATTPKIERENVESIIRRLAREAAAFDGVSRLIERARTDSTILARLVAITKAEAGQSDDPSDDIRYE